MRLYTLLLIGLVLSAVQPQAETPEEVAANYFAQLKLGGANKVAALMHPDELRKFREMLTPIVESGLASEKERTLFRKFSDPKDASKMKPLNDSEFMNTFMEWVEVVQPGFTATLKSATIETLGHVREKDISHVVVRMKIHADGVDVEKMGVVSVKDYQGKPKMILTGEMKGMAEALKRRR